MPINTDGGISFKEAIQEALAEEDSAESDLTPTAIEVVSESDATIVDQPIVESNEEVGLFEDIFVEKEHEEQPDTDSLRFEVDGALVTLAELKSGYMRQADYTRKTQELSSLRDENEKALVLWRALQERPQETVRTLMSRVGSGQPVTEVIPQAQPDLDQLIEQKLAEKLQADPRIQAFEAEQAWNVVNTVFSQIEGQYGVKLAQSDKEAVLLKAQELNSEDLEYAFYKLWEQKKSLDAERENAAANSTAGGRNSDSSDNVPEPKVFATFRSAMEDSLREDQVRETEFLF
jgi:hypothetical protein